jgi:hypothetical protein
LGVVAHFAIEFFVVAHGTLKHRDRTRQCANLVAALAERNRHGSLAGGDRLDDARDVGDRLDDVARDQHRASGGQHDGEGGKRGQQRCSPIDAFVDASVYAASALDIIARYNVDLVFADRDWERRGIRSASFFRPTHARLAARILWRCAQAQARISGTPKCGR